MKYMKMWKRIIVCVLFIVLCMGVGNRQILGQGEAKDVLILHSYHQGFEWSDDIQRGIESVLQKENVNLYIEYMDTYRNKEEQYMKDLTELYRSKLSQYNFDVIICSDNDALNFVVNHYEELFSGVPVIFVGINDFREDMLGNNAAFTGIPEKIAIEETIELGLRLHPDTKQIAVYGSDSPTYQSIKAELMQYIQSYDREVLFIENIPIEEAIGRIRQLPSHTLLLAMSVMRDTYGNLVSYERAVAMIDKETRLPMYSFWDTLLGHGVIGGKMLSGEQQGKMAAVYAKLIFQGEHVSRLPILYENDTVYMFDYGKLREYEINVDLLPEGSVIVNQPSHSYDIDKDIVISTVAIFAGLLFFIGILAANIVQRKRAEEKMREAQYNLQQSYGELEATYEELAASEEELHAQYEALQKSQNDLRVSRERYRLAVAGSYAGVWDWDIEVNQLYISTRGKKMLGIPRQQEKYGIEKMFELIHPDDLPWVKENLYSHLDQNTRYFEAEHRMQMPEEGYQWFAVRGQAIWDQAGKPVRMAGSITNIHDHKQAEEKIKQMAYYDSLTGMPNRTFFFEQIQKKLENAERGRQTAFLFLDVDNFKTVNDSIGHIFGDQLLVEVAQILKQQLDEEDLCARLGGDEFIIVKEISCLECINDLAGQILRCFNEPFILDGREFFVTISIGIAVWPQDGFDAQTLLKNADTAMYTAKASGKNNYQLYDYRLNENIIKRVEMENDLRRALERNELVLFYQPQVDLSTYKIVGAEVLLRWNHGQMGMISPMDFIPIAEETGLIVPIGEWVLKTACEQVKAWQDNGIELEMIAVNLSVRQFQDRGLSQMVKRILQETGLSPNHLELEITESIAIQDIGFAVETMNDLKQLGVKFSMDDFGTGYSSMNYLKKLPIDSLKIDKYFVQNMLEDEQEKEIIKAVITMAHARRLAVIAEGVETREQQDFLRNHACDKAQGYLFSRPLPVKEVEKVLKNIRIL